MVEGLVGYELIRYISESKSKRAGNVNNSSVALFYFKYRPIHFHMRRSFIIFMAKKRAPVSQRPPLHDFKNIIINNQLNL